MKQHPEYQGYRHTFIYRKEHLSEQIQKELDDYIADVHSDETEAQNEGRYIGCNLYTYNTSRITENGSFCVVSLVVIVFFGSEWLQFINDVLHFNETFPSHKIPRESLNEFDVKDENRFFNDLK